MPPPVVAELPEMVESKTLRLPELLKAPPSPVVCAPETVTPEMLRLPPVLIVKILKLPWLALIVSKKAPRPVMVSVPTVVPVPPVPEAVALASNMACNAELRVMV